MIDSGAECIRDISVLLNYFEINHPRQDSDKKHRFYTTASSSSFKAIAQEWLQEEIEVEHVDL